MKFRAHFWACAETYTHSHAGAYQRCSCAAGIFCGALQRIKRALLLVAVSKNIHFSAFGKRGFQLFDSRIFLRHTDLVYIKRDKF